MIYGIMAVSDLKVLHTHLKLFAYPQINAICLQFKHNTV